LVFPQGAFFFNSNTTIDLPGWIHADQPVGALVVGGGTTLNGASQITNGGTNAGSNLTAVRNLFTAGFAPNSRMAGMKRTVAPRTTCSIRTESLRPIQP
jgi:hypothetical protein